MKIMIAGGGTGGHLFPALAVAEAFREREPANEILFVGSRRGMEVRIVPREGYALKTIDAVSLKGKPFWKKFESLLAVPRSLVQSWQLIRSFQPDIVLGVGGYASGPVVLTAWAMGCNTAIHEQNSFPGLSNRILSWFADRIFISFADSSRHFPREKAILTGNPVRKMIRRPGALPERKPESKFTLLIFGGSQGAQRLNRAMKEALFYLKDLKGVLTIIHQTGEKNYQEIQEAYQKKDFAAEVHPFIHDMDRAYAQADLVLCRAGATTIFELMAAGKPSILVPYPFAANDHQTLNAKTMADAGAALLVADGNLTGIHLSQILKELIRNPEKLKAMGKRAAGLAKPDAAQRMVNFCYEMVSHG
ncbi:MAG: undecaprenyldiphospho-muramoylpentapeptide beta-N-acetylglucosaminyltransferase [Thermodesulfobacteriota bacterium]|nr:undecaprenyldiphospho-muramoylpentapeptide beta-N-acetylglucosaminyltransferase [Thermodesulfobacteriota bacterium]